MHIKPGDQLPTFPFQVLCLDNFGKETYLVVGKIYTVVGTWDTNSDQHIAMADLILQDINSCFSIHRFEIVQKNNEKQSVENQSDDWRVWRDQGLQPGECVCRVPKEQCWIHKDA